ncbi:hypothetical protein ABZY68_25445 [Streptomyces sp. NPDC006482]|uniref:hypothetical protein n=1 Tax=Streptomyces sp. NPDC006482 TaxID=3154306 RepID=UPI0033B9BECC
MTDTPSTPPDPEAAHREQAAAAVLPVLTSLAQQATALEQASDNGEQITENSVVSYELAAHHAKHLIGAGGLTADDVKTVAAEHGGTQARTDAERALDHAVNTRAFEATPPPRAEQDRDVEEEIDL